MAEIYWLQRIGNLSFVFNVGFWICVIAIFAALIALFAWYVEEGLDNDDIARIKKYFCKFSLFFAFFTIGAVFTPTEKEMYAIYGIGGTIDYLKNNDKAKQLPDKCIEALNRYVDSIAKEEQKEKE